MMRFKKIVYSMVTVMVFLCCIFTSAFAHSGRTDGSGGHNDNKNKSGLGSYHYHCGGYPPHLHDDGYCPYTDTMPSKVSVNVKKKKLKIGEKTKIAATVSPSNACDKTVSWKNSNPKVVKLDNGVIKAVEYGTATITATTFNGKRTSITITVKEITAEKVTIKDTLNTLYIGDTCELTATISPKNVDNPKIKWTSSDKTIATVDSNGKVQALAAGTVTITAKASNGIKDSKKFTVNEIVAEKIEILMDNTIIHGDTSLAKVIFYPENTTSQEIEWNVDDKNIIQIDDKGNIQGVNVGKATITAIQKDTKASFEIEVLPRKVEKILINAEREEKMYPGDVSKFSAEVRPVNATYQQVYWKVDNEKVAEIHGDGKLEAKGIGTVIVTAYTEDGCTAQYELEVHIPPQVMVVPAGIIIVIGGALAIKKKKKK